MDGRMDELIVQMKGPQRHRCPRRNKILQIAAGRCIIAVTLHHSNCRVTWPLNPQPKNAYSPRNSYKQSLRPLNLPLQVLNGDLLPRLLIILEPLALRQINPVKLRPGLHAVRKPVPVRAELGELAPATLELQDRLLLRRRREDVRFRGGADHFTLVSLLPRGVCGG